MGASLSRDKAIIWRMSAKIVGTEKLRKCGEIRVQSRANVDSDGRRKARTGLFDEETQSQQPINHPAGALMRRVFSMAIVTAAILSAQGKAAADPQVDRGKYLVTVGGCNDCHTPGGLLNPDMTRMLGGGDVAFGIRGLGGAFVPPNLTPDKETGLGNWTTEQIVTAFTTGVLPNGRVLAPWMPWKAFLASEQR